MNWNPEIQYDISADTLLSVVERFRETKPAMASILTAEGHAYAVLSCAAALHEIAVALTALSSGLAASKTAGVGA